MTPTPPLERLVGSWATEATHPALPGVVVHLPALDAAISGEG